MDANGILQILLYIALIVGITPLLGGFITRVFRGERTILTPLVSPLERAIYRLCGASADGEQHWTNYAGALVLFNLVGVLFLYGLQRLQGSLPLNPQDMGAISPDLAFNTAVSFVTNTNWQSYGGESTMSYLLQMLGFTVQNFLSAATGIAVAIVLIRGFARHSTAAVGNVFVDLTRATLYLLLPLCLIGVLVLVWQGVPQTFDGSAQATTLEGVSQLIARGPVASQMMIKHLGTNGGGFFSANAAHPFENPTALVNLIHMVAIFSIGAALTNTFGRMVGDVRQGWALLAAMGILFVAGVGVTYWAESSAHPVLSTLLSDPVNLEGKETRFGIALSSLFAVITTAASCGAVNAMHDSFTALGGMIPMINMMLGEVVIGGVGAGLYGMIIFAILAVFLAGLMVGRTPEYVGKKLEAKEVKFAIIAILSMPLGTLVIGSAALLFGPEAITAPGPHGLSELVYAYTSATANNGSAFGGFSANAPLHNTLLALSMLVGRFLVIIPVMGIAGALAAKKSIPLSSGTMPTHGGLFISLLVGTVLIIGGLTFFPVLAQGPIAEHLALLSGTLY